MRLTLCITVAALAAACGGTSGSALSTNRNDVSASTAIPNSVPGFVGSAPDLGAADPSTVISVTAWLKLQNESKLDQLIQQQQTKGHPNYHRWLSQTDFNAQFSPTSQQVNAVTNFLAAHNLTVIDVAENNFYVRVSGTIADVEKTFHVQIDNFSVNGETHRANTSNPNDGSGGNIAAVTGLDDLDFRPSIARPAELDDSSASQVPLASVPDGKFTSGVCFPGAANVSLSGAGHTGSFSGNAYRTNCGYDPAEMRAAYNLGSVYAQGLTGAGQTIAIIDEWGSDSIAYDADVFSQVYGLPRITSDNFQVVKAQGLWHNTGNPHWGDWTGEVTLDVEWAHAIAPGAKIALVVAPDQSLFEALNLAVARGLGNTISNSWSNFEGFMSGASVAQMERILKHAAAKGIDVNFSSGDWGDNAPILGVARLGYPASSPNATAVGGTSLALRSDRSVQFETGWGTNISMLWNTTYQKTGDATPITYGGRALPWNEGFIFGAGGGSSIWFAKPSWQSGLAGTTRQVPDISMDADPYTGVEIIQTIGGTTYVEVIGGTSLACPMFSGVMALAAQAAGHGLGQVAPLLYGMTSGIRDIHAVTSSTNVTGTIDTTSYSADQLAAPIDNGAPYYSALYHGGSTRWYALTFGTDTTLATTDGWDKVTGLGVPDGANFVSAVIQ